MACPSHAGHHAPATDDDGERALDFARARSGLLERAFALGLTESGDVRSLSFASADAEQALILQVLEHDVPWRQPDDAETRRWFDANRARYRQGESRVVSHVLYALTPGTPAEALHALAQSRLDVLRADPGGFEALAATESNCPSGAEQGRLGRLLRGDCVPEFDRVVFGTTALGLVDQVVATRHGFHLVRIDAADPGRDADFAGCRDQVAMDLAAEHWITACRHYLERMVKPAATPLVQ